MADKEISIKVTTEADITDVKGLSDELSNVQGKAEELSQSLQEAFQETNNQVEELTEQLAQIEMGEIEGDYDEVAQQLEEATTKAEALEEVLNSIDGTGLDNATSSTDGLASGLDNATGSAEALNMELMNSMVMFDVANQLGEIGSQAEGMAQQMDTASITVGQLATNVGMAEPEMRNLISYISNVTFPEEEAMAYVKVLNQMGVSADKLGDSATNMDKINDATHMGADKVMLLTQGLQALGISADNLPASFNAIAYAEANVGGGAETLQQVLRRQAGTLNEYGMNVDATVVALSALQRETGLTGMKLGSEFSTRLKDCNGDINALEQSLGLQAGALSKAGNETSKYSGKLQALADEEMEHKTITERLGAVWEDLSLQFSWILSPMADVIGLIGSFGQTALAINSIVTLGRTIKDLEIIQKAYAFFTSGTLIPSQIAEGTAGWFSIGWMLVAVAIGIALGLAFIYLYENCDWFREGVNNLANALKWLVGVISNSVMGTFNWLMDIFKNFTNEIGLNTDNWIEAIIGFIAFLPQLPFRVAQLLVDTIASALGFGDNFTQTMYDNAVNGINGFLEPLYTLPETVMGVLQGVWDYVLTLGGLIPQQTNMTGNQIIDSVLRVLGFIANLPMAIATYFINIIAQTLGFGNNFSQNMINAGINAVNGFVQWITSLPSKLKEELDKMLDMASNFAIEIADKLSFGGASMVLGWITGSGEHSPGYMYDALIGELQAMVNAPLEFLSDLPNNLMEIGALMVQALQETFEGTVIGDMINDTINSLFGLYNAVVGVSDYIMSLGGLLPTNVAITGNAIIDGILRVMGFIATLPIQLGTYFTNMIAQALGFGTNFSQRMFSAGLNAVNNFVRSISNLSSGLVNELNEMISDALNFAGRIGQILWNAGINAITNFLNALDRHSPGIMQREFIAEVTEMGNRVPSESRNLISNMGKLGADVVDAFGNPTLTYDFETNGKLLANLDNNDVGRGQVNNFYFSDITIDDDERMQKIVDYIKREIDWNNTTAGRTN